MSEAFRERYESTVDRRIREGQERGAFDGLAGQGRPLRGLDGPDDENWWLRGFLEREGLGREVMMPTPLRLRKELEGLPDAVRDMETEAQVRAAVRELNARIGAWTRNPDGPRVLVRPAVADDVVAGWRAGRAAAAPAPTPDPPPTARRRRWWRR